MCIRVGHFMKLLSVAGHEILPVLRCNASKWSNYTARCIVSGSIRYMRHHITAVDRSMCVIVSNVNFRLVY